MKKPHSLLNEIENRILSGEIRFGQRITEEELARKYGVSRTPVRDALRDLEMMGILQRRKKGGTYLRPLTPRDLVEIYDLRASLESLSARQAAERITEREIGELRGHACHYLAMVADNNSLEADTADLDFHQALIKAGGNRWGIRITSYFHILQKAFRISYEISPEPAQDLVSPFSHDDIINALEKRDGELAASTVARHITGSEKHLAALLREQKAPTCVDARPR